MNDYKIYQQVNALDSRVSFGISSMKDIYEKRQGQTDEPHRHDYYTILVVKYAKGKHIIDFCEYPLENHQIYFVSPGQVHQVIEEEASEGFSLVFSAQFLVENNIVEDFISDLQLFDQIGETPPLQPTAASFADLYHLGQEMQRYYKDTNYVFRYEAIGAYLKLFLIACHNHCTNTPEKCHSFDAGYQLLKSFKQLINTHYKQWHKTSEYAQELYITADHLNKVVKGLTGKTAKEHIQHKIVLEAKRMLFFTDYAQKEIAYELGFSEPAHFSSFFKKQTGSSPSKFKISG